MTGCRRWVGSRGEWEQGGCRARCLLSIGCHREGEIKVDAGKLGCCWGAGPGRGAGPTGALALVVFQLLLWPGAISSLFPALLYFFLHSLSFILSLSPYPLLPCAGYLGARDRPGELLCRLHHQDL